MANEAIRIEEPRDAAKEEAEERARREVLTRYALSQTIEALKGLTKEEAARVIRAASVFYGVGERPQYTGIRGGLEK